MAPQALTLEVKLPQTQALLKGVNELALLLIPIFRDGVQLKDAIEIFEDIKDNQALRDDLDAAYHAASQMGDELKAIDLAGGIEIAVALAQYIPKIVDALKAAPAAAADQSAAPAAQ